MNRRLYAEIDPAKQIPLSIAPEIIGRSLSTIYRWIDHGLLTPELGEDGVMTVTPAQLKAAEARVTRGRPSKRNTGNVG